jgi:ABC-type siderophore export system fused ATPase/permease subunit
MNKLLDIVSIAIVLIVCLLVLGVIIYAIYLSKDFRFICIVAAVVFVLVGAFKRVEDRDLL